MKYRITITSKSGKQHVASELTEGTLRVWIASFFDDADAQSFFVERA